MRDIEARQEHSRVPTYSRALSTRLSAGSRPHGLTSGELVKLHHSLIATCAAQSGLIAQFVAPEPEPAARDVVYDLAYMSAAWLGRRVLFVDGASMRDDAGGDDRPWEARPGFVELLREAENAITRVVGLDLYQMKLPSMRGALEMAPMLRRIPEFMTRLRENFDLVLISAPPASDAPMGMILSPFVDGNVLVLGAGRTRVPVAIELRDSLRTSGGTVIGAVLTHYHSFIPRFLRRWL
jgi:hypothetical protein